MNLLPRSTDVFVIGGGPAGLAAAIAARRRGFQVLLADCSVPPIDKACGEGIMPDGLAAARSLGIDLTASGAQPFRGIRFCAPGVPAAEAPFPSGHGLGLRRTALHHLMVEHALQAGVQFAWGARITGIRPNDADAGAAVEADGRLVRTRWIVGADGGHSAVRRWAGLDASHRDSRRFGFRRHYAVAPWSEFMEIHWGDACQLYITPVGPEEICVVSISRNPHLRLDDALPQFPDVARRLSGPGTLERGGVSASRRLKAVCRGRVALVGDASGSVDAITGEGLCLLFQQAVALAAALDAGDLALYQAEHRRIGRRPEFMADVMLLLDRRTRLRRRALRTMASHPRLFARMLAMHVGQLSPLDFFTNGLAFGWRLLTL
ncbi:Monooxygenase, FAD-binding [Candidatus Sulfopaludibacter sp. SbA4]|nr:Monooxygenase, FAD-binding [Candidatus Sulfopaludibacter sp. SbA4]